MDKTIAMRLAEFIHGLEYRALPRDVIEAAKACILDQFGCQIIGSAQTWNKVVYDYTTSFREAREATIVNYGARALAHDAAFVNATFGQGAEFDDGFEGGGCHPGSATIPVAMALCENDHLDGRAFINSVVAGYDIAYHLTRGMMPALNHVGFHAQTVIGVFSAAAVAGKLMRLNVSQMTHAFAIAGSHASGTTEFDQTGGEVKRMHTGLAVRGGMHSAGLARAGLTGPPTIFEGKRGIMPVFCGKYDAAAVTANLGTDFGILHVYYKKHPTVGEIQCSIDVMTNIMDEHHFDANDIQRIDVGAGERLLMHGASIYEPHDAIGAQFSLAFSLAIRLLKHSNDLSLYTDSSLWKDARVLDLAHKVHAYADPKAEGENRFSSRVKVTLRNRTVLESYLPYPKGMPKNPLTREEREAKFSRLARTVLPEPRIKRIIRLVDKVEEVDDVAKLIHLLVRQKWPGISGLDLHGCRPGLIERIPYHEWTRA
ncbi:MAG: MmgE/PrpD family protein [Chloroflexi bacterium]|nr:MmgE/PrpD family protein [Chloroflexota bacterium]